MGDGKKTLLAVIAAAVLMAVYFALGHFGMTDDGFQYEGFTESAARGVIDFKSFYGFQGLSFFAVPIFWLTRSHNSIIIMSAIFSLLSIPLAYLIGKKLYRSSRAGIYFLILFLLTPYPYTTMMRGFQEAALLFFILLIIYSSISKKIWTPMAWAVGGIVKPFALVLFPLFIKDFIGRPFYKIHVKKFIWIIAAILIGVLYLGVSYHQTGHLVINAAINSYQGNFDPSHTPPLVKSFTIGIKGPLRVVANLLLSYRKIMISPFLALLGLWALWKDKTFEYRNNFVCSIILNFLLLSFMTFSFSKYLLPMTTLLALASVGYLLKNRWLMILVFADSVAVFLPIWNYFGFNYWSNVYLYLTPLYIGTMLFLYEQFFQKHNLNSNS